MSEAFTYENSDGGSQKGRVQIDGTVAFDQVIARMTLVGQLTATLKWQILDFTNKASYSDFGFTVEAVDSSDAEINTSIFVEGEFNQNHVTFDYDDTADDWRVTLAGHGIYLRDSVNTSGY